MSVTFGVESPVIGWVAGCSCGATRTTKLYATYALMVDAIVQKIEWPECIHCAEVAAEYGQLPYATAVTLHDEAPEVNISNINARDILRALGLLGEDRDLCGSLPGAEFAARVTQALVMEPQDTGVPAVQIGSVIECGRREGYVQEVLTHLQEIGNFAWDKDLTVTWA